MKALEKSKRLASVEIIVVILPTECSVRAFGERRKDLRKIVDITPARSVRPVVIAVIM